MHNERYDVSRILKSTKVFFVLTCVLCSVFCCGISRDVVEVREGVLETYIADRMSNGTTDTLFVLHCPHQDYSLEPSSHSVRAQLLRLGSGSHVRAYVTSGSKYRSRSFQVREQQVRSMIGPIDDVLDLVDIETVKDDLDEVRENGVKLARNDIRHEDSESVFAMEAHSIAVVLLDFQDVASVTCAVQDVRDYIWGETGSLASFFRYATNTKIHFLSEGFPEKSAVFGPFSISVDFIMGCDTKSWVKQADQKLAAIGVDLSHYGHVAYVIPSTQLCSWEGLGTLSCKGNCKIWIQGCDNVGVAIHEIGHNFGLQHAASRLDESGEFLEYNDPTSIMGNCWLESGTVLPFNAPHMEQMQWIDSEHVLEINESGTYHLSPLDLLPEDTYGRPQIVKLYNSITDSFYYISFYGLLDYSFSQKMIVHRSKGIDVASEFISMFEEGDVFRDINYRSSVEAVSINATTMVISVIFGCVEAPPVLDVYSTMIDSSSRYHVTSLSPLYLSVGVEQNISLTLHNNNAFACIATNFLINASSDKVTVMPNISFVTIPAGGSCVLLASVRLSEADSSSITFTVSKKVGSDEENYVDSFALVATTYVPVHPTENCYGLRPNVSAAGSTDQITVVVGRSATMTLNVTNLMVPACGVQSLVFGIDPGTCTSLQGFISIDMTSVNLDYLQSSFPVVKVQIPQDGIDLAGYSCSAIFTASSGQTSTVFDVKITVVQPCDSLDLSSSFFLPPEIVAGQYLSSAFVLESSEKLASCRYPVTLNVKSSTSSDLQILLSSQYLTVKDGIGSVRVIIAAKKTISSTDNVIKVTVSGAEEEQGVSFLAATCQRGVPLFRTECDAVARGDPDYSNDPDSSSDSSFSESSYSDSSLNSGNVSSSVSSSNGTSSDSDSSISSASSDSSSSEYDTNSSESETLNNGIKSSGLSESSHSLSGHSSSSESDSSSYSDSSSNSSSTSSWSESESSSSKEMKYYSFSCHILLSNADSPECPNSTFIIQRPFNGTSFIADEDEHRVMLAPGEWTRFVINFSVPRDDIPPPPKAVFVRSQVVLDDTLLIPEHNIVRDTMVRLSQCVLKNVTIDVEDGVRNFEFCSGEEITINLTVTSMNSMYCNNVTYYVSIPSAWMPYAHVVPSNYLELEGGEARVIQLVVEPVVTASLVLNVSSVDESMTNVTKPQSLELQFFQKDCVFLKPHLLFPDPVIYLPVGKNNIQNFNLTYVSKDWVSCDDAHVLLTLVLDKGLQLYAWTGPDGINRTEYTVEFDAVAAKRYEMKLYVQPEDNIFPGSYNILVNASLKGRVNYLATAAVNTTLYVSCSFVELPYNITTTQVTPFLATKPVFQLSWRGCESPELCCCPCIFSVYRNSVFVANTTDHTYLDDYSVTVGEMVEYSVLVTNAAGLTSANDSCTSLSTAVGQPANLASFLIMVCILVFLGVVFFISISLWIIHHRYPEAFNKRITQIQNVFCSAVTFCFPCLKPRFAGSNVDDSSRKERKSLHNGSSKIDVDLDLLDLPESEPSHGPHSAVSRGNRHANPLPIMRPDLPNAAFINSGSKADGSVYSCHSHSSGSGPRVESDLESKSGTSSAAIEKELLARRR